MKRDIHPRTYVFEIKCFIFSGPQSSGSRSIRDAVNNLSTFSLSHEYPEYNHKKAIEKALYTLSKVDILDVGLRLQSEKSTDELKVYEIDIMTEKGYSRGFIEAYCKGPKKKLPLP